MLLISICNILSHHPLVEIEGGDEVLFSFFPISNIKDPHTLVEIEGGGPIWHQAASNMWGCSSASHYMGRSGWEGEGASPAEILFTPHRSFYRHTAATWPTSTFYFMVITPSCCCIRKQQQHKHQFDPS